MNSTGQSKTDITKTHFRQQDCRRKQKDRRKSNDRRSKNERRHDFRDGSNGERKTIRVLLRSLAKARLGVDRRKEDRRRYIDRRQRSSGSILTQDEISDLLS